MIEAGYLLYAGFAAIVAVMLALLLSAPGPAIVVVAYFGGAAVLYLKVIKPKAAAAGVLAAPQRRGPGRGPVVDSELLPASAAHPAPDGPRPRAHCIAAARPARCAGDPA